MQHRGTVTSFEMGTNMTTQLTHLQQLEAESIHIIREVVAEFGNPDRKSVV